MATDKDIQNLVINKLTKEQFEQVEDPSPDELWLVEDEDLNINLLYND